jgi:Tfp pilus assembly protein PilF
VDRRTPLSGTGLPPRPTWQEGQVAFEAQRSNKPVGQATADPEAIWSQALVAANRALQIDPRHGEPYAVRALHAQAHNLYGDAYRNFRKAVARSPSNPELRHWFGGFLMNAGYPDFIEAYTAKARENGW